LIPAFLGLFSGGYTMLLISGSLLLASIFAPAWAWVIFTIDRTVVANTKQGKLTLGVLGRLFLAVIIAFTISEPVILKLFSDAIEDKRLIIVDEKQTNATKQIDTQIAAIKDVSGKEKAATDALNKAFIQEVDGTGGSRVVNRGPIAEVKWGAYQNGLDDYNKNEASRNRELAGLGNQRTHKLQVVSDKDAKGFLGNLRILGRLMEEDTHVWWCVWLVRLLFLAIELIPIFIKLGSSSDYDLYVRIKDLNDKNQELLQIDLVEAKRSVMKSTQILLLQAEKLRLQFEDTKMSMNSSTKFYEFFLDKIKYASEQKLKAKFNIIEKVKDEILRSALIVQIDQAYDGYVTTLDTLMQKAKQYHTSADL
jgi:hypothetical protein